MSMSHATLFAPTCMYDQFHITVYIKFCYSSLTQSQQTVELWNRLYNQYWLHLHCMPGKIMAFGKSLLRMTNRINRIIKYSFCPPRCYLCPSACINSICHARKISHCGIGLHCVPSPGYWKVEEQQYSCLETQQFPGKCNTCIQRENTFSRGHKETESHSTAIHFDGENILTVIWKQ